MQRCFLYVHYIDPHWPYTPPSPFDQAFDHRSDPPIRGGGIKPTQLVSSKEDQEWVGRTIDQYDGEILFTDQHVGRLLKGLEELDILDNALVIVTADHGEEFREHGKTGHSKTLYEEVLHVPFLLYWPGRVTPGSTYDEMVGLVDVMPTILTFLGLEPPAESQGFSFAPRLAEQTESNPAKKLFAQLIGDRLSLEMVRNHRYKFIRHVRGHQEGLEEFYDLKQDPLERNSLVLQGSPEMTAWRLELDAFNKFATRAASQTPEEQVQKLDSDTERALRALGYIK